MNNTILNNKITMQKTVAYLNMAITIAEIAYRTYKLYKNLKKEKL